MIIDFHTHTFPDKSSEKIVNHLAHTGCIPPHTDGSVIGLFSSMKEADIDYSVNLPVMTKPGQVEKVNSSLIMQKEYLLDMKIITFGGMHPDYVNYKEELLRLKQAGIPGIKLHPAYQNVDLDDIRMMRIIDEASSQGLITLVHSGIDIGVDEGTPVHAADGGTVAWSGWMGGYGYAVVIDHGNGMSTLYGHNSELAVSEGQDVGKGQVIAYAGSTGNSTGPHVHFEVRISGDPVDPMGYL